VTGVEPAALGSAGKESRTRSRGGLLLNAPAGASVPEWRAMLDSTVRAFAVGDRRGLAYLLPADAAVGQAEAGALVPAEAPIAGRLLRGLKAPIGSPWLRPQWRHRSVRLSCRVWIERGPAGCEGSDRQETKASESAPSKGRHVDLLELSQVERSPCRVMLKLATSGPSCQMQVLDQLRMVRILNGLGAATTAC
jgi:hypothetical protein